MPWRTIELADQQAAEVESRNKRRARFLVDESVGPAAAWLAKRWGWNAKYAGDLGLTGRPDEDVYAAAARDDRVILSHDRDFLNDRRFPLYRRVVVVVLPGGSGDTGPFVRGLWNALQIVGPFPNTYIGAKLDFASDGTITIRRRGTVGVVSSRYRLQHNAMPQQWLETA